MTDSARHNNALALRFEISEDRASKPIGALAKDNWGDQQDFLWYKKLEKD